VMLENREVAPLPPSRGLHGRVADCKMDDSSAKNGLSLGEHDR
jgi:hypothetical protein